MKVSRDRPHSARASAYPRGIDSRIVESIKKSKPPIWEGHDEFVAIVEYGDTEKVKALHPVHREYLRRFLENEQLRAAGPFANDEGELWVLDAETAEAAEEIVKGDLYVEAGAIVS